MSFKLEILMEANDAKRFREMSLIKGKVRGCNCRGMDEGIDDCIKINAVN